MPTTSTAQKHANFVSFEGVESVCDGNGSFFLAKTSRKPISATPHAWRSFLDSPEEAEKIRQINEHAKTKAQVRAKPKGAYTTEAGMKMESYLRASSVQNMGFVYKSPDVWNTMYRNEMINHLAETKKLQETLAERKEAKARHNATLSEEELNIPQAYDPRASTAFSLGYGRRNHAYRAHFATMNASDE